MSKRYTGNFISGTPQVPTLTSNNGIFDIKDVYTATSNNAWQEPDGYYEIGKSLRFRGANSNYLSRSQAADGNRKAWTFSAWVKLGGDNGFYMCAGGGTGIGVDVERMQFNNSGNGWYWQRAIIQTSTTYQQDTNGRWRDPSAWYHIMCIWDSNNATQAERWRTFVNGVKQTRSYGDGAVSQGQNSLFNSTAAWKIGRTDDQTSGYADCYMAEVNFIDGQVLDPTYFGYNDPVTNIWQPKPYTGTYGTYGFYLPFSENQTTKNLGRNFAGGTNFCAYSESVGSWGNASNCTITSNTTTAPNGTTTAGTVTAGTTASAYARQDTGINMGISTYYTMSIYLKAGTATTATLSDGFGTGAYVTVDLTTGAVTTAYNPFGYQEYSVTFVGNGWYRLTMTLSAQITNSNLLYFLSNSNTITDTGGTTYTGNGTSGVYIWGAQLELGSTATTYQPIIGSQQGYVASQMKYNLVNPQDTDAAFRLVFNGGWTFDNNGATPNGTNAYADSKLNPIGIITGQNSHVGFYSRTNNDGLYADFGYAGSMEILTRLGNVIYADYPDSTRSQTTNTNSQGCYIISNTSSFGKKVYKNESIIISSSFVNVDFTQNSSYTFCISAFNNLSPSRYSNRQIAFSTIGDGLTDTDASNLYNRVQTFQTSLSRQV